MPLRGNGGGPGPRQAVDYDPSVVPGYKPASGRLQKEPQYNRRQTYVTSSSRGGKPSVGFGLSASQQRQSQVSRGSSRPSTGRYVIAS